MTERSPSTHNLTVWYLKQMVMGWQVDLAEEIVKWFGSCHVVTGAAVLERSVPGVEVIAGPSHDKRSVWTRMRAWLGFALQAFRELAVQRGDVLMLITSDPPILPGVGYVLHRLRGYPYVVLVVDVYPDAVTGLGRLPKDNVLIRLWGYANRLIYARAKRVVTLSPRMAESVQRYMPQTARQLIAVIPSWTDTKRFVPREKCSNPFAATHKLTDKFVVMYSGNIGESHDLDGLVSAARRLRCYSDIRFAIFGAGTGRRRLEQALASDQADNILLLPLQPDSLLPFSLACADVAVVSMRRGTEGVMFPGKAYNAMAVGSAILGLSRPPNDLVDVISRYECGINVEPGDEDGIVEAIQRFYNDRILLSAYRQNARRAAVEYFSRQVLVPRFIEVIESVLTQDSSRH